VPEVTFTLRIDDRPADAELLAALQQIEIEDHADLADIVVLRFAIGLADGCDGWTVVDSDAFQRLSRLEIHVTIGSRPPERLVEAYVIETNADFSNQPGASTLEVTAIDSTILMHLEEKIRDWPNAADSDIASTIFTEHNFTPDVETTQPSRNEDDVLVMQRGTDIRFLKELAERNGFECYAEVDPLTGQVQGHFHPPRLEQPAQGVLSVNMGPATNVNSFSARNDMLKPTKARITGLDVTSGEDQPGDAEDGSHKTLGRESTLSEDRPRITLLSDLGLAESGELSTYAQGVVDRSSWSITADGELNTVAYGRVLRAKRPVLVRGAGTQFSGTYYVTRVQHTLSGDGYTQRFTLMRNAAGLSGDENFAEDSVFA
jgi:phage protein D